MQHYEPNEETHTQQRRNKRQRRHPNSEQEFSKHDKQVPLFLPTHLSLLRALHADDQTAAGADSADSSCPRPSWVEVNSFLELQRSMMKLEFQTSRIKALTLLLLPPMPAEGHHHQQQQEQQEQQQERRRQRAAGIEGIQPLDPRSVVSAVLRRAAKEREDEHVFTSAGLRGLRKSVDDTVEHLSFSLEDLARSRRDRATPWRIDYEEKEEQDDHAADVLERHTNKLLLWRRLQAALSLSRVGVN